MTSGKLDVFQ